MSKIESKKVLVNASSEEVYTFLSDLNNIQSLLPNDKISNWRSDTTSCSFKVQGAYTIGLNFHEGLPHSQITYSSSENSPFAFTLTALLQNVNDKTEVYQVCDAQLNSFLEMVVKGPLKNLFDYMIDKLRAKYSLEDKS